MKPTPSDPALDARLRSTLRQVAAAAIPPGHPEPAARAVTAPARRPRRRWRPALVLAAVLVPLTAAGVVLGREYVDQIPPKNVFYTGVAADGERYWLVPSFHDNPCDPALPHPGIEWLQEARNSVGGEWASAGFTYGDYDGRTCAVDEAPWLADPGRVGVGSSRLGADEQGERLYVVGAHPTVVTLRVTVGGRTFDVGTVPVPGRADGPRYAAFPVPAGQPIEVSMLDGAGAVVPGGRWGADGDGHLSFLTKPTSKSQDSRSASPGIEMP
ncbi:hypothetical protein F4553_000592 [Allocatelliglobosispora scoriae]|uniref:Uncharacterized protein n=1 Tax=Allocatelliglobosispora scoriae TaxID=643052 RepID=A0A841BJK6_9ACTN|nr:hypothetical protein [Allocatelliglobosispora scoriae]MBB5867213.1 hypothetical protein [Allocatelliglobosispora scoriae]